MQRLRKELSGRSCFQFANSTCVRFQRELSIPIINIMQAGLDTLFCFRTSTIMWRRAELRPQRFDRYRAGEKNRAVARPVFDFAWKF